jgi:hypothetical protein
LQPKRPDGGALGRPIVEPHNDSARLAEEERIRPHAASQFLPLQQQRSKNLSARFSAKRLRSGIFKGPLIRSENTCFMNGYEVAYLPSSREYLMKTLHLIEYHHPSTLEPGRIVLVLRPTQETVRGRRWAGSRIDVNAYKSVEDDGKAI